MQKTVIVINGSGGVGKDTLCNMAAAHYAVRNISSITPIKELAAACGWDGTKDDRSRKFLADLKQLTIAYNDYPLHWLEGQYRDFLQSDDEILFVHIREPKEIEKFVRATEGHALTLLVRGGARYRNRRGKAAFGNAADDDVENYDYDYCFYNSRPLADTEPVFLRFLAKMLRQGHSDGKNGDADRKN